MIDNILWTVLVGSTYVFFMLKYIFEPSGFGEGAREFLSALSIASCLIGPTCLLVIVLREIWL